MEGDINHPRPLKNVHTGYLIAQSNVGQNFVRGQSYLSHSKKFVSFVHIIEIINSDLEFTTSNKYLTIYFIFHLFTTSAH